MVISVRMFMVRGTKRAKADVPLRSTLKWQRSTLEQRLKIMAALVVLITAVVRLIELIWTVLLDGG